VYLAPFAASKNFAYSCQTWLAARVNDYLHPGEFYCWFSTDFNPYLNGDSSNPLWLYMTLDRAVKQGDFNQAKVRDVRTGLMRAAEQFLSAVGRNREVPAAIKYIVDVDISYFRQIWRLDLERIDERRYQGTYQYGNEFLVEDLKNSEFEIIIE
jgi:hypothetical protein